MATLTIRQISEETKARLRERAAREGRSMEAEVRAILEAATRPQEPPSSPERLWALVDELYSDSRPENVVEDLIAERRQSAREE